MSVYKGFLERFARFEGGRAVPAHAGCWRKLLSLEPSCQSALEQDVQQQMAAEAAFLPEEARERQRLGFIDRLHSQLWLALTRGRLFVLLCVAAACICGLLGQQ